MMYKVWWSGFNLLVIIGIIGYFAYLLSILNKILAKVQRIEDQLDNNPRNSLLN